MAARLAVVLLLGTLPGVAVCEMVEREDEFFEAAYTAPHPTPETKYSLGRTRTGTQFWDGVLDSLADDVEYLRGLVEEIARERGLPVKGLQHQAINRRRAEALSVSAFREYERNSTPVVITGLEAVVLPGFAAGWKATVAEHCEEVVVPAVYYNETRRGLQVERNNEMPLSRYIDLFSSKLSKGYTDEGTETQLPLSLVEWSLPLNCPELLANFTVPRYFSEDFFQRIPEWVTVGEERMVMPFRSQYPHLHVNPQGVGFDFVVASFAANQWLYMAQGTRQIRLISPSTPVSFLYGNRLTAKFEANCWDIGKDIAALPLLSYVEYYDVTLSEGEVLYIPPGTYQCHRALTDNVMFSSFFIDAIHLNTTLKALQRMADVSDVAELLGWLGSPTFPTDMDDEPRDTPWWEYKKLPEGKLESSVGYIARRQSEPSQPVPGYIYRNWRRMP